jgi:hypothetical protein
VIATTTNCAIVQNHSDPGPIKTIGSALKMPMQVPSSTPADGQDRIVDRRERPDSVRRRHEDARGVVRCAFQGCDAEPTDLEAAEAVADAEARAARWLELDWRPSGAVKPWAMPRALISVGALVFAAGLGGWLTIHADARLAVAAVAVALIAVALGLILDASRDRIPALQTPAMRLHAIHETGPRASPRDQQGRRVVACTRSRLGGT